MKILDPVQIQQLNLSNRVVMAPMTRSKSPGGIPGEDVAQYYGRRAKGGVGLIITEGTPVAHPTATGYPDVPIMGGKESLAGWKKVVDAVHAHGGKIFPQLWHVGSVRQSSRHENAGVDNPEHCTTSEHPEAPSWAPSAIPHPYVENAETPHAMTEAEIGNIVDSFAQAARDAIALGFDGIELHGAHGYLIDQFFWDQTNQRTDRYGGDLKERTRFAVEVIKAVRKAIGPEIPLDLRFSQWKLGDYSAKLAQTPQELESFLTPLVDAGVDIFHCSTRRFWEPEFENSDLNLAGWVKKITGLPTITVGSVGLDTDFIESKPCHLAPKSLQGLEKRLTSGEFDLVAVGRALLADPEWLDKVTTGRTSEIELYRDELLATLK